jgi:hypothetical protein
MERNRFDRFEVQEQTLIWTALHIACEQWQKDAVMMMKGTPNARLAAHFEGYVATAAKLRDEIEGEDGDA